MGDTHIHISVTAPDPGTAVAVHKALGTLPDHDLTGTVVKSVDEKRYTLAVAYPALKPDVVKAMDGHRDFMGPDALEETAWRYAAKSRKVGLWHQDGTEGQGTIVESYIYRGPDWELTAADGTTQVIKAGDWLVGTVWDEIAWAGIKTGAWNGMSPQGRARRTTPSPERLAELRSA